MNRSWSSWQAKQTSDEPEIVYPSEIMTTAATIQQAVKVKNMFLSFLLNIDLIFKNIFERSGKLAKFKRLGDILNIAFTDKLRI